MAKTNIDKRTRKEINRILNAKPVRSLQEDPLLTHNTRVTDSEEELWVKDLVKQSKK